MLMKDNLVKTARNRQTYKREAESMDCVELGVEHGVQVVVTNVKIWSHLVTLL